MKKYIKPMIEAQQMETSAVMTNSNISRGDDITPSDGTIQGDAGSNRGSDWADYEK